MVLLRIISSSVLLYVAIAIGANQKNYALAGSRLSNILSNVGMLHRLIERIYLTQLAEYPMDMSQTGPLCESDHKLAKEFQNNLIKTDVRYVIDEKVYAAFDYDPPVKLRGLTSVWPFRCRPVSVVAPASEDLKQLRLRFRFPNLVDPKNIRQELLRIQSDRSELDRYSITQERAEFLYDFYQLKIWNKDQSPRLKKDFKPIRLTMNGFPTFDRSNKYTFVQRGLRMIDLSVPITFKNDGLFVEMKIGVKDKYRIQ